MPNQVIVRELHSFKEQAEARAVFDLVWPLETGGTEITSNLMQSVLHNGGYLSGAYDGEKIVGATFAFPSIEPELHIHSHMSATIDGYRDQGIGYQMKVHQYHWAREHGYKAITWTYDPLVKRNAKFNLIKLGVDLLEYLPNFYGEMEDALNKGDETDRLMVRWDLTSPEPKSRTLIEQIPAGAKTIAIPEDIVSIREANLSEAIKWRHKVRGQFQEVKELKSLLGLSVNGEYVFS